MGCTSVVLLVLVFLLRPVLALAEPVAAEVSTQPSKRFPDQIVHPPTHGTVDTDELDIHGSPIGVACATCHSAAGTTSLAERPDAPKDFHDAVVLKHGELRCASCHEPEDRTLLRLADGETLQMGDVIKLCQQCHGPQYRSFVHGAHGGARGYWDTTRGPRIRNSCVACHAAHEPQYPLVFPAPPPRDRIVKPKAQPSSEARQHE